MYRILMIWLLLMNAVLSVLVLCGINALRRACSETQMIEFPDGRRVVIKPTNNPAIFKAWREP